MLSYGFTTTEVTVREGESTTAVVAIKSPEEVTESVVITIQTVNGEGNALGKYKVAHE